MWEIWNTGHSNIPTFQHSILPTKYYPHFLAPGVLQELPAFCLWTIQMPLSDPLTPSNLLTTPPNDSLTSSDHQTTSLNDSLTPSDHLTKSPSDSLTSSEHLMHASDQLNKPCESWMISIKELNPKKWKKIMKCR